MATAAVGTTLFDGIQFSDPSDIEAILLGYGAVRSGVLEEAVRIDNADQAARNQRINDLNRINTLLQRARPQQDAFNVSIGNLSQAEVDQIRALFPNEFDAAVSTFSIADRRVRNDGAYQQLLDTVRGQVDQASANSQLELIALQALINRRNQAVEFTTNLVQRFSSLRDRIIGNIRN